MRKMTGKKNPILGSAEDLEAILLSNLKISIDQNVGETIWFHGELVFPEFHFPKIRKSRHLFMIVAPSRNARGAQNQLC